MIFGYYPFEDPDTLSGIGAVLIILFSLWTFIPKLAIAVRRLHDTGRSGWWVVIDIVPLIGPLVILIFTLGDSQAGKNQYGPNPKAIADQTDEPSVG
jgi:uncharacterized membrane protein YhaH (DUF805 family)